jgi:hypothetical protein
VQHCAEEGYDEDTRAALIRGLVACLPAANRALLKRLCGFFDELATHADITKMHFENLATVFGAWRGVACCPLGG